MTENFLLTIVTVVRNDINGLNLTINSVAKNFPNADHCIIDGSDQPLLLSPPRENVQIFWGRDRGISHAFNKGLIFARGDYVLFINAGDELLADAQANVVPLLLSGDYDCLWFPVYRIYSATNFYIYRPRLKYINYGMSAPHQGMIVRRIVFSEIGLFPLQKYSMDHYLAMKLCCRIPRYKIGIFDFILANYPVGGHSTKGGVVPFLFNMWNTLRIAPERFLSSCVVNFGLAVKSILSIKYNKR